MPIADSLVSRISGILLAGAALILGVVALAVMAPTADDAGRLFRLPKTPEVIAIVRAVEASRGGARPLVVEALDTSVTRTVVRSGFPPILPGSRAATAADRGYPEYAEALGGRAFRIDVLGDGPARAGFGGPRGVQIAVRLADGEVLVIQRRPPQTIRSSIARVAGIWAAVALILLVTLLAAVRQTARPVAALAGAVRRFGDDLDTPDLPLRGPRELRDLSGAFNGMKQRIRELVVGRTRLLAAIAHDMRTYLTRLRLRAEFIEDEEQRRRAVRDLEELSDLLDDTLLFARRDDGKVSAPPVEVMPVLRELVDLRVEMGGMAHLVEGPSARARVAVLALRRIVSNLLDNALRYGDQAWVGLDVGRHTVRIVVLDNGPGAAEADLARLMEPFERGEASRNRETGGAGLGLAIVKSLAEAHGGTLVLRNTGGGLEASVTLPRD
jgi:two-component system osmolarity sensor histidine kinase EnvZ